MSVSCPLCQGDNPTILRDTIRNSIKRNVLQCQGCSLIFLEPNEKNLEEFYSEDYRKVYGPTLGRGVSAREMFETYLPLQKPWLEEIRPFLKPTSKVLDIGSATGHFLYSIRHLVKECVGLELNQEHARFANEQLGIKTYNQPLREAPLPENYFDIISVLDVLEHIPDPINFLKRIGKHLSPEGILYLRLPNIEELLITVFDVPSYLDFYYHEPHLFYYSKKTLALLLDKAGFEGQIKGAAYPNVVNQLNWIFKQEPQANAELTYAKMGLPFFKNVPEETRIKFINFFQKIDKDFKEFLAENFFGSALLFIGKKRASG